MPHRPRDVGAATGSVTLSRMGGASIAISIYGAIIGSQLGRSGSPFRAWPISRQLTPKMMAALPEATRQAVAEAYASAFTPLFMTSCAICPHRLVMALVLKPVQLPAPEAKKQPTAPPQKQRNRRHAGRPSPLVIISRIRVYICSNALTGCPVSASDRRAERLFKANPRNLIRLTPAEGLDA